MGKSRLGWPVGRPAWLEGIPALSIGLAVVWLVTGLFVQLAYASHLRQADRELEAAVSFAIHNPEVVVGPRLLPVVRSVIPDFDGNEVFSFLRKQPARGGGRALQRDFDGKVARAFATLDSHPYRRLGWVPAAPSLRGFAAHWLLHAGWLHLFATLALWSLVAPLVERLWGPACLAGAVLLATAAGAGAFAGVHPGADRPLLGASPIAAGLVCALLVRRRGDRLDLLGWLPGSPGAALRVPAWVLGALWVGYAGVVAWSVPGALPTPVAAAAGATAQAAGAVTGGLLALAIARVGWERDGAFAQTGAARGAAAPFDLQEVISARTAGDPDRAFDLLAAEVARSARNRDAVTTYWEMAIERDVAAQAAPALKKLVREELRRGADEVAVAQWRELTEHLPRDPLEAPTLVRLLPSIRRIEGDEHAVLALQQLLDPRNRGLSPELAAQAAHLAADLEMNLALDAARRALAAGTLAEGPRVELQALVRRLGPPEPAETDPEKPEGHPPSVFYAESDRSDFGEVGDLSELDDPPEAPLAEAVPRSLDGDAIELEVAREGRISVELSRLRAVAVAGVHGLGPKPVVLVDLLVDGRDGSPSLRVIRLSCNRFDPRRLVPDAGGALDAVRRLVARLLAGSGARPLPDADGAAAKPVRIFGSLEEYQRQVLRAALRELA
jgi:membrane associated rhomboid family serine protease